jgi:hypothetical protein
MQAVEQALQSSTDHITTQQHRVHQFRVQTAPSCQGSTASGSVGWDPLASACLTALSAAAASRPQSCCPC